MWGKWEQEKKSGRGGKWALSLWVTQGHWNRQGARKRTERPEGLSFCFLDCRPWAAHPALAVMRGCAAPILTTCPVTGPGAQMSNTNATALCSCDIHESRCPSQGPGRCLSELCRLIHGLCFFQSFTCNYVLRENRKALPYSTMFFLFWLN